MIKWEHMDFFNNDDIPNLLGYKSPIEVIQTEMESRFEENIFQAVQRFGINVNKEELIKALDYDRHQYERGLEDGKRLGRSRGHWNIEHDDYYSGGGYVECSICNMRYSFGAYHEAEDFYFCPKCGASMREDFKP